MNARALRYTALTLSVAVAAPAAAQDRQALLKLLPADAAVCIWFQNPQALSAELDTLAAQLHAPSAGPGVAQVLAAKAGVQAGFDPAKPAAMILPTADLSQLVVILCPTDLNQMLAGREKTDLPAGLIQAAKEGEPTIFLAQRSGFALIASQDKPLQSVLAATSHLAETLSPQQVRLHGDSDVSIHVTLQPFRPQIDQALEIFKGLAQMGAGMPGPKPFDPELTAAILQIYVSSAKTLLDQVQSADLAVRFEPDAIAAQAALQFDPTGSAAAYLAKQKPAGKPLLRGLPARPYFIAGGFEWVSSDQSSLATALLEKMLALPAFQQKLTPPEIEAMRADSVWFYQQMTGFNMLMHMAEPQPGLTMFGQYFLPDPAAARQKFTAIMATASKTMSLFVPGMTVRPGPTTRQIAGLSVDEYAFDFSAVPPEQQQMLQLMYGKETKVQLAEVPGALLYTMAPGPEAIQVLAAVAKGSAPGLAAQPDVAGILDKFPKDAIAVFLMDLTQAARFGSQMMAQAMGRPTTMPTPTAPAAPPLGFAMSFDRQTVAMDVYIPTKALKATIAVFEAMHPTTAPATAPATAPDKPPQPTF